jgi:pimeloyl-ACP methyl ester carboxylesterase
MPYATAVDGTQLFWEETGSGEPILFVHEYAGDFRSWETQVRHFSRRYRCITFNARGYPPSDVPSIEDSYSQDLARDDVIAVMDAAGIHGDQRVHLVGHSMGAYTALHVALAFPLRCQSLTVAGCGWGSQPGAREESVNLATDIADMFRTESMEIAAKKYAAFAMRAQFRAKDPKGFAEFVHWMSQHSNIGHALTMLNVQIKRPTIGDLECRLKSLITPTLIILGDEDDACIDGSMLMKRSIPNAGLLMLPCSGHTINSEEPDSFNAALTNFFSAVENGRWKARPQG